MSLISNDFPGMAYLGRLQVYTNNPTPIKGIDFVCPLALKALERIKDSANKHPIKLDSDLNLDDKLDEVWISGIQKAAENLPPEVIEKLSEIFKTFLVSKEDIKSELAIILIKISQENNIDLFKIFEEALNNQEEVFDKFKSNIKEIFNLTIKIDVCKKLLDWIKETEFKRVSIIYEHCRIPPFSSMPKGLNKAKKDETYELKMKYFNLIKEIDQTIYSNELFLNFYKNTSEGERFWEEEVKTLIKSNEVCLEQKFFLEREHAQELLNINERYEILLKKEKEEYAQSQDAFRIEREIEKQREAQLKEQVGVQNREIETIQQQILNLQNQQPSHNPLDVNNLMLVLKQKQNKNKKCVVM